MTLKTRIHAVDATMRDIVCEAARLQDKPIRLRTSYADGTWDVEVQPNGTTLYSGYAEEERGRFGTVEDLTMWELAMILEPLAA
jgi:hypothetical protein